MNNRPSREYLDFDIRMFFCLAPGDIGLFPDLVKSGNNWEKLYKYCTLHGITGLVYYNHLYNNQLTIPDYLLKSLKMQYFQNSVRNLLIKENIATIGSDFKNKGIDLIILKGFFLLDKIYPDYGSRYCGDIDFLIRKTFVEKVEQVFVNNGFTPFYMKYLSFKKGQSKLVLNGFYKKDIVFDLHYQIFSSPLKFFKIDQKLWDETVNIKLADIQLKSLNPEMVFIHLCHHTYRHLVHGKMRLSNFYDLYFLLLSNDWKPDFNKIKMMVNEGEILYSIKLCCAFIFQNFPEGQNLISKDLIIPLPKNIEYFILENDKRELSKLRFENGNANKIKYFKIAILPPADYLMIKYDFERGILVPYFYMIHLFSNMYKAIKWLVSLFKRKEKLE